MDGAGEQTQWLEHITNYLSTHSFVGKTKNFDFTYFSTFGWPLTIEKYISQELSTLLVM